MGSNLVKNREGFLVSDTERECTNCHIIFQKTSKTVTLCNKCNTERVKCTDLRSKMFMRAKSRAKKNNLAFNLTLDDILIPKFCPILEIELNPHSGISGGKKASPALDRIDSTKGYIKGNVWVISHLANMMKSNANNEDLVKFSNWVLKNIDLTKVVEFGDNTNFTQEAACAGGQCAVN